MDFKGSEFKPNFVNLSLALKVETYTGMCRCCLAIGDFRSLLESGDYSRGSKLYAKMLQECYDLNIVIDERPLIGQLYLICAVCEVKLKDSYEFKLQVIDAQKMFENSQNCDEKEIPQDLDDSCDGVFKAELEGLPSNSDLDDDLLLLRQKKLKSNVKKRCKVASSITKEKKLASNLGKGRKRKANDVKEEQAFIFGMDKENLQCRVCSEVFKNFHLLNRHINIHYPNHICEICGKGHATRLRLRRHRVVHATGNFTCEECGKVFATKSKFENHRAVHILPLRYMCPECPERFSSFLKRQRHMHLTHNREVYTYKCEQCDKVFITSGNLTNHRKRVHLKVKNHTCQHCGKSFFDGKAFRDHGIVHSGERTHQCDVCLKSYSRLRTLKMHMRTHATALKQHACSVCGQRFAQKATLKGHMKAHVKTAWYQQLG